MNFKATHKAQILVTTLLVLMILAIVVVGVVMLLNREVTQVTTTRKFQELYNVAETKLQERIATFSDPSTSLTTLSSVAGCSNVPSPNEIKYECITSETDTGLNYQTLVTLKDTKDLVDVPVLKDEALSIPLSGYRSGLEISWDKNYALEFSITYFVDSNSNTQWDAGEQAGVISDIYNNGFGAFDSPNSLQPLSANSPFPFTVLNATTRRHISFNINNIVGYNANYRSLILTIIPRTKLNTVEPTNITIRPSDYSTFPYQLRVLESASYDPQDPQTPVAGVTTQFPVTSTLDSLFNYALITEGAVTL